MIISTDTEKDFPSGPVAKEQPASVGTQFQSLLWDDANASGQQSPCAATTQPTPCNKRSRCSEKPTKSIWRKSVCSNKDPAQTKINKQFTTIKSF